MADIYNFSAGPAMLPVAVMQQARDELLERAREHGAIFVPARLEGVEVRNGRVSAVRLRNGEGATAVSTPHLVNAAGPFLPEVARMIGVRLPISHELHLKVSFRDCRREVARKAPLLIWTDPVFLPWSDEERTLLARSEETKHLLNEFPSGVHVRPEGGPESDVILILWTYDVRPVEPLLPFSFDPHYPEIALRGLAVMIPGLSAYFGRIF